MAEVRTMREGTLYWVQASGTGSTWATASAAVSGLFGFVRSMNYTSGLQLQTIAERGTPDHHKVVSVDPIQVSVQADWTGYTPAPVSGSGASVPMYHLEYKAAEPENGNSGRYLQFHGVPLTQTQWTEGDPDNIQLTFVALAMNGPTASGYVIA